MGPLVRALERYTKTDAAYLLRNGFWLTTAQAGIGLLAFGVSVAFAHFVTKEAYGTYRYLLSLFWTLSAFSFSGITLAMSRAVARGMEGAYRRSFRLMAIGSLPILVAGGGGAIYYFLNNNAVLGGGLALIALIGTFWQPSFLFGSFLEGKSAFKMNALFGFAVNAVPALLLVTAMQFTQNPLIFLGLYLFGNVATGFALSAVIFRLYRPNEKNDAELGKNGFHLSLNTLLSTAAGQADELLMFHFLGPAAVATYSFATALPDQIKNFTNSIGTLAFPKFATRPLREVVSTLGYRLVLLTLGIGVMVALYWFGAPILFSLFFPAYLDAVPYSQIYALALIPATAIIPTTLLEAQAARRELYILNTVGPVVQILVLLFAIVFYGIVGALIARFFTRLFSLLLSFALVHFRAQRLTRAS